MKNIFLIILFQFILFQNNLQAQIEDVLVEKFYISDSNDATDTSGGWLEDGSVTYRIFLDLMPGTRLRKIYGDANHALNISSTEIFFNNKVDGQTFGKDFSKNRLDENTVALDTWITLGQITRVGSKTYFGVLKMNDDDGSFIGGLNNDGGSNAIPGGLLVNNDPSAGLPLYNYDGYDTMTVLPTTWVDYGFLDISSNVDSTIFGSAKSGSKFTSNNAGLQNSGVMGVTAESNHVLVAQLTTKGEISFELNIEVEENVGSTTRIVKYVANDDVLLSGEKVSPFLKFPRSCGCTDPDYLEYSSGYGCENLDSCITRAVLGCMDSLACNFDPEVNLNIPEMCCYPGYCNDRDISIVCPSLATSRYRSSLADLYPNPAQTFLNFKIVANVNSIGKYEIYDSMGRLILENSITMISSSITKTADVSQLETGVYFLRLSIDDINTTNVFIKN